MIGEVIAVHPSVVMVKVDQQQIELPRSLFPQTPVLGQRWSLTLTHEATEDEKRADLNALLPRG